MATQRQAVKEFKDATAEAKPSRSRKKAEAPAETEAPVETEAVEAPVAETPAEEAAE